LKSEVHHLFLSKTLETLLLMFHFDSRLVRTSESVTLLWCPMAKQGFSICGAIIESTRLA